MTSRWDLEDQRAEEPGPDYRDVVEDDRERPDLSPPDPWPMRRLQRWPDGTCVDCGCAVELHMRGGCTGCIPCARETFDEEGSWD